MKRKIIIAGMALVLFAVAVLILSFGIVKPKGTMVSDDLKKAALERVKKAAMEGDVTKDIERKPVYLVLPVPYTEIETELTYETQTRTVEAEFGGKIYITEDYGYINKENITPGAIVIPNYDELKDEIVEAWLVGKNPPEGLRSEYLIPEIKSAEIVVEIYSSPFTGDEDETSLWDILLVVDLADSGGSKKTDIGSIEKPDYVVFYASEFSAALFGIISRYISTEDYIDFLLQTTFQGEVTLDSNSIDNERLRKTLENFMSTVDPAFEYNPKPVLEQNFEVVFLSESEYLPTVIALLAVHAAIKQHSDRGIRNTIEDVLKNTPGLKDKFDIGKHKPGREKGERGRGISGKRVVDKITREGADRDRVISKLQGLIDFTRRECERGAHRSEVSIIDSIINKIKEHRGLSKRDVKPLKFLKEHKKAVLAAMAGILAYYKSDEIKAGLEDLKDYYPYRLKEAIDIDEEIYKKRAP